MKFTLTRGDGLERLYNERIGLSLPSVLDDPSNSNEFHTSDCINRIRHLKARHHIKGKIQEHLATNQLVNKQVSDRWTVTCVASKILASNNKEQQEFLDIIEDERSGQLFAEVQQIMSSQDFSLNSTLSENDSLLKPDAERNEFLLNANPFEESVANKVIKERYEKDFIVDFFKRPKNLVSHASDIPLSMHCKDERIFRIDDFENSKVRFVHHDVLDHAECFYVLRNLITRNHQELFRRLRMPTGEVISIMNREGELVAAISYAYRQFYFYEKQPENLCEMSPQALIDTLKQLKDAHAIKELEKKIEGLASAETKDWKLYSHVICNCLLEAEELQWKYGFPTLKGSSDEVTRLDPWDPSYISFIIDAVSELGKKESSLPCRVSLLVEREFQGYITKSSSPQDQSNSSQPFKVSASRLKKRPPSVTGIPEEVKIYIKNRPHFSAS